MHEQRALRQDLWPRLNTVTRDDWIAACGRLGLEVCRSEGRGSHILVRKAGVSHEDPASLVATIIQVMYKQANQKMFRQLLRHGFEEGAIWRSLKLLR